MPTTALWSAPPSSSPCGTTRPFTLAFAASTQSRRTPRPRRRSGTATRSNSISTPDRATPSGARTGLQGPSICTCRLSRGTRSSLGGSSGPGSPRAVRSSTAWRWRRPRRRTRTSWKSSSRGRTSPVLSPKPARCWPSTPNSARATAGRGLTGLFPTARLSPCNNRHRWARSSWSSRSTRNTSPPPARRRSPCGWTPRGRRRSAGK